MAKGLGALMAVLFTLIVIVLAVFFISGSAAYATAAGAIFIITLFIIMRKISYL